MEKKDLEYIAERYEKEIRYRGIMQGGLIHRDFNVNVEVRECGDDVEHYNFVADINIELHGNEYNLKRYGYFEASDGYKFISLGEVNLKI